jgi:hypothetical protein
MLTGSLLLGIAACSGRPGTGGAPPARLALEDGVVATPAGHPAEVLAARLGGPEAPRGRFPAHSYPSPARAEHLLPRPDGLRVGLEVLVDGEPLPTIRHRGKTYLPVPRLGVEYRIRVRNHGPRRVAAVVSVDGLSVINGRPASAASPGYLVAARSSILIPGWRRSLEEVAAFSFRERDESYAARMGRPENVGVIGLLAIEERAGRPPLPLERGRPARSFAKGASRGVGGTGTGYGRDLDSPAYYVPFVRGDRKRTLTIHYDTVEALRRAGVPVGDPIPFPGDGDFAPPPPGRRGR